MGREKRTTEQTTLLESSSIMAEDLSSKENLLSGLMSVKAKYVQVPFRKSYLTEFALYSFQAYPGTDGSKHQGNKLECYR